MKTGWIGIGSWALAGCIVVGGDCPHCDEPPHCVEVALRDANGEPDGCDLAACTACAESCGEGCAILESYPPQYACEGESWDVYDFCPDWSGATPPPRASDVVDLGCGADGPETLTAVASGPGRVAVVHVDATTGCCPEAVEVGVDVAGAVLAVSYTLVEDLCDCACELDVAYDLVDVPAGSWTIVAGPSAATASVVVP